MVLQIQHLLIVFTGKFTSFDNVGIATQQLTVTDLRNLTIEILNLSVNYIFSTNPMSVLFTYTVTDAAAHSNSCTLQVNLNPAGTVADTTPPTITGCPSDFLIYSKSIQSLLNCTSFAIYKTATLPRDSKLAAITWPFSTTSDTETSNINGRYLV